VILRFDTVWAGQSHSDTLIFAYCQWQLSSISGDGFESELSGGTSLEYAKVIFAQKLTVMADKSIPKP
jgi:hypothetical protein